MTCDMKRNSATGTSNRVTAGRSFFMNRFGFYIYIYLYDNEPGPWELKVQVTSNPVEDFLSEYQ